MDLREYLLLLLRRWPVVIVTFLLVAGSVVVASLLMPSTYSATASVYVRAALEQPTIADRADADQNVLTRIKSYALAVNTEAVLLPVIDELKLKTDYSTLNRAVTAEIPSDTYIIDVTVEYDDARVAADIANAFVDQLHVAAAGIDGEASAASATTQFSVMQRALPPESRISPNLKLNGAIAILLGLFVAVAAAVLTEAFDSRLRRGGQLSSAGVRHLSSIPQSKLAVDSLIHVAENDPSHSLYRSLALEVLFTAGQPPFSMVVTSTGSKHGTTTVSANLASALAAAGNRVLYVDLGAGSRLAPLLGVPETTGITDVLTGSADLDMALMYWKEGGFSILPHGSSQVMATETYGSAHFRKLLAALSDLFDVILFDTPPILTSPEAGLLLQSAPHALLVTRARTHRSKVEAAASAVERAGAQLMGAVLNRAGRRSSADHADDDAPFLPLSGDGETGRFRFGSERR